MAGCQRLLIRQCLNLKQYFKTLSLVPKCGKSASALFVSNAVAQHTSVIDPDLQLNEKLADGLLLKQNLQRRGLKINLDMLLDEYQEMVRLKEEMDNLHIERDSIAKQIAVIAKYKSKADLKLSLSVKGKKVRESLKKLTKQFWTVEERVMIEGLRLPISIHDDTPMEDTVIKKNTDPRVAPEWFIDHVKLGQKSGCLKFCDSSIGAYYMLGDLALLEQALLGYFKEKLDNYGFISIICPDTAKAIVTEGCGYKLDDPNEVTILKPIETDSNPHNILEHTFLLSGSSLIPFAGYLARTCISENELPLKLFTSGMSYFETGIPGERSLLSRSRQVKQIHLFTGVASSSEADYIQSTLKDFLWDTYQQLNIPMRLVNVSSSNLKNSESKRTDLEVWVPSLENYCKIASVSQCMDYLSRRLMMTYAENSEAPSKYCLHNVHGSFLSVPWLIAAIMENHMLENNSVCIPSILHPFWLGNLQDGLILSQPNQ